jgi:hypothetical protein
MLTYLGCSHPQSTHRSERIQQEATVPDSGDAELSEILCRQTWKHRDADLILAEGRLVLLKTQPSERSATSIAALPSHVH